MSGPAQQLWNRLRGTVRECLTFSEIKDVAGSAGLSLERLAHLQQRQMPSRSNSKTQLLDEIGALVAEVDEFEKREVVLEFLRKCIGKYPDREAQIIQQAEKAGFSWDIPTDANVVDDAKMIPSTDAQTPFSPQQDVNLPKPTVAPFISYAREDAELAQRLFGDLTSAGCAPWLDSEKLLGGQNWATAIRDAIRSATHFLALISKNSVNKRGFVQKELAHAMEILDEFPPDQVFVIPIRADSSSVKHERLRQLQWIDLFPSYDVGLRRIVDSLGMKATGSPTSEKPQKRKPAGDILDEVRAIVRARAKNDYPDDFSTRKYVIENELAAWRKLDAFSAPGVPFDIVNEIIRATALDYPDDFSTRLHVIENEIKSWRDLQALNPPDVPVDILNVIKSKAEREYPKDFGTRLYVIQNEIQSWKDLQE